MTDNSAVVTVLGAQWGDEGKGKLVDILAKDVDVCCRFNGGLFNWTTLTCEANKKSSKYLDIARISLGGANAGHTLVVGSVTHALHLIPCGILSHKTMNLLGHGMVIHLKSLNEEIDRLETHVSDAKKRIFISSRAHLLFDFHLQVDEIQETKLSDDKIGTTKRGIGPCYSTKMARTGIRACQILNWQVFETKFRTLAQEAQEQYGFKYDVEEELKRHKKYAEIFGPMVIDGLSWLHSQINLGKKVLIEGANATFLDIDFGTYPCVTSSSTTIGGVCTGLGLPPLLVGKCVIGVVKAYTTRVGEGPFPTELKGEIGNRLTRAGHEIGTTTGRPRRCGWLDIVMLRYTVAINGLTQINLTKLDVLTGIPKLNICISYEHITTGKILPSLAIPASIEEYNLYKPVYEELPGWTEDLSKCRTFLNLPINTQNYILRIEKLIQCPITWIGVGSSREAMIIKSS